jgi:hypothetical protein
VENLQWEILSSLFGIKFKVYYHIELYMLFPLSQVSWGYINAIQLATIAVLIARTSSVYLKGLD